MEAIVSPSSSPAAALAHPAAGDAVAQRLRAVQDVVAAGEAAKLALVAGVLAQCERNVPAVGLRVSERAAFVRQVAVDEVACTLGTSAWTASGLVDLADRLVRVLPRALRALSEGRLDLPRVRVLAELTAVLDDDSAGRVADELLANAGAAPWDGPSPRAWRARVERAVVRADAHAASRRRAAAVAARRVRAWAEGDGLGVFQLRADAADVALVDRVVDGLARAWPEAGADGVIRTVDQRRADAVVEVFRRIGAADADAAADPANAVGVLPHGRVRRVHDLGLVLHADTLFDDGPRASAVAQLRGLGAATALDPASARLLARRRLGEGTGVQVLVVDDDGALQRVVRLDAARAREVTASRQALHAAVHDAEPHTPPLGTSRYQPTTAIVRHVHAEAPTCSFYDCPRTAAGCDLDHDVPWPRGPSAVTNLDPKCRRHHQAKTHQVVRSHLRAGTGLRSVTWTLRSGLSVTTRPEPLPGCDEAVLLRV